MTVKELKEVLACMRDDVDVYFDADTVPVGVEGAVPIDGFIARNPGANNYQLILQYRKDLE